MQYRPLGRTGLNVSEICLGTMTWGSQNSEAEGHAQMDYAVGEGVNFFDTAEMYPTTPFSPETIGGTEAIIGTWFAASGRRDAVILATKVLGSGGFPAPHGDPLSAEKIRRSCEASLKRLKTDRIDLYQLHWPNRGSYCFRQNWTYQPWKQDTARALADIEAALEELGRLVDEGKVLHVGVSNETAWGVAQYARIAEARGLPRIASIQNEYSLLDRKFDTDLAEACYHEQVSLLTYSSLAAGWLTGKYRSGVIPAGSRRTIHPNLGGRINDGAEPVLEAYFGIADRHSLDPSQMALAWTLQRPLVTSVIIGATSMEQLKTCIGAKDLVLPTGVLEEIEAVHRRYPIPM